MVGFGGGIVRDALAEQRRILVSGALDRDAISVLTAQLMAFDEWSSRGVEIVVSSPGGPVSDVLPVLGVLDLMRAEVQVIVIGSASGTAVGLVAAGTAERRAPPRASFSLRLDATQSIHGTAEGIVRRPDALSRQRSRCLAALSAATGQDEAVLVAEATTAPGTPPTRRPAHRPRGARHTAHEAPGLEITDTIVSRL